MKKLLSLVLALAIVLACFNLGISFVNASDTKNVSGVNLLDENTSTFENGETSWFVISKGTIAVVDNPKGEGKVIKYTHTGENSHQSPAFNLRPFVTKAGRIYISFDICSPDKDVSASFCVCTDTANILSACTQNEGTRGSLYSSTDYINNAATKSNAVKATKGIWHRFEYAIDITQADIDNKSEGAWNICFDGLNENLGLNDVFYIDNVVACYSEHDIATKTDIVRESYTKVGTVRWDAFTKSTEIPENADLSRYSNSSEVARVLSPAKYHYRAPFFANITAEGKIAFPEYTMEIWEQEALYAHEAGLDYFSYLWYETTSEMSKARKLHLQSEKKNLVQMSGILEHIRSAQTMFELFTAMKDPCWLRVSGRPVLFLYNVNATRWTAQQVKEVRQMAYRAGISESLYIIGMNTDYKDFDAKIYDRDMDAVTLYSLTAEMQGEPYSDFTLRLENKLQAMIDADPKGNHQVVPFFSMGFDARPRIEKKVSWITEGDPNATTDAGKPFGNKYTTELDILTFKEHFAKVYNLTQKYTEKTQPNLVFSYAWNEHDEGGWLCPTLNCDESGSLIASDPINTERIDALRDTLDEIRQDKNVLKPTADPNAVKTIYNGNAESGIDNWGFFHGGSLGYVQPGANGSNNAIRFIPSNNKNKNESIAYYIAPAIINDADYNLKGCGVGHYKVSFYAKAGEIPSESNAIFSVGLTVDSIHKTSDDLIQYLSKDYGVGTYKSYGTITLTSQWQKYTININITESYLQMLKELRTGIGAAGETLIAHHPQANKAYDILLRLDGANNGFKNGSYEYFIDELTIEYSADNVAFSKPYPTPTPYAYVPNTTPEPTAIPQNSVINYLEYELKGDSAVITGSKMDIHGEITIPNAIGGLPVTEIQEGAFKHRALLTKITLPENLQVIGDFAFDKCINLKTVVMSENVESIGTHAFCGATKLTGNLVIPKAITEIKPFTFHKCENIQNAQYLGSEAYFENNVTVKENNGNIVSALSYKPNSIEGATLNIGSSLNIDYYAYFEADASRVTMRFVTENGAVKTVNGVYDDTYKLYKFTYTGINPQCMTDTIDAELLLDGETVLAQKDGYSVKAYCDSLAGKSAGEIKNVKNPYVLKILLADTLIYGKEAQLKQGYKLDDPADASEWIDDYRTSFVSPTGVKVIQGNRDNNNYIKSASLQMANVNRVFFRFVLSDENVVVTLNDTVVDRSEFVEQQDGSLILYTEDIKATEFDKVFTLKLIKDDETFATVKYNLNAYIQAKYSSSAVGTLVQALNNYGVAARDYQDMLNGEYNGDYDLGEEDGFLGNITPTPTINNLIPAVSSNFNQATTFNETGWGNFGGVQTYGLADDGNGGKCIYFDTVSTWQTLVIDLAQYIKEEGQYTISFRYKVKGQYDGTPFSTVIRASKNEENSFIPLTDGQYRGSVGTVEPVEEEVWGTKTATLDVRDTDIGKSGRWQFGVHSIAQNKETKEMIITRVYIDDLVVEKTDYSSFAQSVETAETWVMNEAVFVSDYWYDDAYRDATMDLILTNGHVEYEIPCFWDGGKIWRARFVCPTDGVWTYTTECSDKENTGLNNQTGRIECQKYLGDLDIYKHGFVTANYNGATRQKYFTYADGTPFFYLGDTHWNFAEEPMDVVKSVVNKRAEQGFTVMQTQVNFSSKLNNSVNTSNLLGFAKYDEKFNYIAQNGLVHAHSQFFFPDQMDDFINYFGKLSGDEGIELKDIDGKVILQVKDDPNTKDVNEKGQPIILYGLNTKVEMGTQTMYYGYVNENGKQTNEYKTIKLYDFSDTVKQELERLSRYWVARYSAYPVMWTLGQEVDNDFMFGDNTTRETVGFGHPSWGKANNPYKLVAEYIGNHDPYKSALSAHQEGAGRYQPTNTTEYSRNGNFWDVFGNVTSHTWYASQWKVKFNATGLESLFTAPKNYWNNTDKVVVNYEGFYDMLQTKEFGARAQGWLAYLNGMFGYGWGGQGTWQYQGNYTYESENQTDGVDNLPLEERMEANDWKKAINLRSAEQMGYMRKFFENTVKDWHTLIPRFDDTQYLSRSYGAQAVIASNEDSSKIVVYFLNFSDKTVAENINVTYTSQGKVTGTLKNLSASETYNYMWYNPRTGKIISQGTFTSTSRGTWDIGNKQTCDMVLYVYK